MSANQPQSTLVPGTPRINNDAAGRSVVEYSPSEKRVALALSIYLLATFMFGLWSIADTFVGRLAVANWLGLGEMVVKDKSLQQIFILALLTMSGGWLGGTIAAMRSLQEHYSATVENSGDLEKQEAERFHTQWWIRWFWGPWVGTGLALIVFALVRSGVLVFAAAPPSSTVEITVTEKFASFGLGGLVGIGAKDVVEKLVQVLKAWLRVEEPELQTLRMTKPDGTEFKLGSVITFEVTPNIPVTWGRVPEEAGTIANGIFVAASKLPDGRNELNVVVSATSTTDQHRIATKAIILR
jgi:hypothetical protein